MPAPPSVHPARAACAQPPNDERWRSLSARLGGWETWQALGLHIPLLQQRRKPLAALSMLPHSRHISHLPFIPAAHPSTPNLRCQARLPRRPRLLPRILARLELRSQRRRGAVRGTQRSLHNVHRQAKRDRKEARFAACQGSR